MKAGSATFAPQGEATGRGRHSRRFKVEETEAEDAVSALRK
jgi:hypothetical protein